MEFKYMLLVTGATILSEYDPSEFSIKQLICKGYMNSEFDLIFAYNFEPRYGKLFVGKYE